MGVEGLKVGVCGFRILGCGCWGLWLWVWGFGVSA